MFNLKNKKAPFLIEKCIRLWTRVRIELALRWMIESKSVLTLSQNKHRSTLILMFILVYAFAIVFRSQIGDEMPESFRSLPVTMRSLVHYYVFSNLYSNFWLILANFERPVLGCIEAEFCK